MIKLHHNEETHWILPCESSRTAPRFIDQGWRTRVHLEDGEGRVFITEEQVLPEKVDSPFANRIRATNGTVRLNLDEALFLRDVLEEVIPMLANQLETK